MFFRQRIHQDASISYLLGCSGLGKAIAVDVLAGDEDWFVEQAQLAGAAITHVIDTHVHADHYSGGRTLAAKVTAPYCLHAVAQPTTRFTFEPLQDGQILDIGNVKVTVLHTPGHTDDSICLLVADLRRSEAPWFVLTGDTLFVGAVGRPDLAGQEQLMAGILHDSLHVKLLSLPDALEIFPAHQAGSACGAGLSGKHCSTIGFEKRNNPTLALNRDDFINVLMQTIPPRPANMDVIIHSNLGLALPT